MFPIMVNKRNDPQMDCFFMFFFGSPFFCSILGPLHSEVLLSNIGAKACTTLGSMGPRLAVGDIKYEDFNAEAEDWDFSLVDWYLYGYF